MAAPHPILSDPPEIAAAKRQLRETLRAARNPSPEISARIVDLLAQLLLRHPEPGASEKPLAHDGLALESMARESPIERSVAGQGMASENGASGGKAGQRLTGESAAEGSPPDDRVANEHMAGKRTPADHMNWQRIACVWPLSGEVDLRPLCLRLHEAGKIVLLPETPPRGKPLLFRRWQPDSTMLAGRFGTAYPDGLEERPDLVLVPLLGFDRKGSRLGYGGGYYDRTLAALPGTQAIGYATAASELPAIPIGPHDQPLLMIVTETECIACG